MASNKIQVKRTSVTGRTPNTTNAANTQYIDAGEFALNITDGILYSSNGSSLITIGSNLVNQSITGSITVGNSTINAIVNSTAIDVSNSTVESLITVGNIKVGNSTVNVVANSSSINAATHYSGAINATSTGFLANSTLITLGNTSVNTTINTSAYSIGTTLIANSSGLYTSGAVNAASHTVGTVFVANSTTLNANGLVVNSTGAYATGLVNAANFYTTGVVNAASHTVGSTFVANSTTLNANGLVVNSTGAYVTGVVNAASHTVGSTFVANSTTLNANGLVVNSTGAYATGLVNAANFYTTGVVNATSHTVGTVFVANSTTLNANGAVVNSTGAYVTGLVNATSVNIGTVLSITNTSISYAGNVTTLPAVTIANTGAFTIGNGTSLSTGSIISIANTTGNVQITAGATSILATGQINAASFTIGSGFVANTTTFNVNNNIALTVNNKKLSFTPLAGGANVYFIQQSDDNFVFYTSNTSNGVRPVYSIFANSDTSSLSIAAPVLFNGQNVTFSTSTSLFANGSAGSAGQVLASNGTAVYWVSPSAASVNTAAQFTWTNTHIFQANVSFSGNGIGIASNTGAIYLGGIADSNWKIARNAGVSTKWRYTNNTIDIITANSNLEGMTIGLVNGNSYFETGYLGTYIASNVTVGNTSSNVSINSTSFAVGSTFVANSTTLNANGLVVNSTGAYVTGLVNAASFSTGPVSFTSNTKTVNSTTPTLIDKFTNSTFVAVKYMCSVKDGSNAYKHFSEISAINEGADISQSVYGEVYTTSLGSFTLTKNADTTSVDLMFTATAANATNTYSVSTIRFNVG